MWDTKLGSFDIKYNPRNSVKGQVLTDFVAEFTLVEQEPSGVYCVSILPWTVYVDGASNAQSVGIGIVVMSSEGVKQEHFLRLGFRASNNEAEYKALNAWIKATLKLEVANVKIYSDSRLVVNQVNGSFEAKDSPMVEYLKLVG